MRTNVVKSVIAPCASLRIARPAGASPRRITGCTAASARRAVRTAGVMAATLAVSIACSAAHAQTTSISGSSFSGAQTFDATSGTGVITGNATLSADTTFNLGFQINYLLVGGGGGGGGEARLGGGGGGGAVVTGSTFLTGVASVSVGGGGVGGIEDIRNRRFAEDGGDSTLSIGVTVLTGTGGRFGQDDGGPGGDSGNGNAGGSNAGGGGGAGGAGGDGSSGSGGNGLPWAFGDGTLYGAGGGGYNGGLGGVTGGGQGGNPGFSGTTPGAGGGGGFNEGGNGAPGTVRLAYLGGQTGTATNGTQTGGTGSAADYTLVSFTSTASPSSFTVTSSQLASRLAATLTGTLTGSGGLTFGGPGSLTLAGNSLYTGPTTVNGGSLFVNGQVNSPVTVSGSSLLGGSGTVAGAVGVATGGTLAPGATAGSTGRLSMTSLTGTSYTIALAINGTTPGTDYDQISATTLDYSGATLAVSLTGSYADGTAWDLFDFTTQSGTLAGISPLTASLPDYNGLTWGLATTSTSMFDQRYGAGIWLSSWGSNGQRFIFNQADGVLTVVPEPSTFVMAAAGLAGCVLLRRRRARKAARKPATACSSRSGSR